MNQNTSSIQEEFNKLMRELTNQTYEPSDNQKIMMGVINEEREKAGVAPLKFLPGLKPIAEIRVRMAHEKFPIDEYCMTDISQNKELFLNTEFEKIFQLDLNPEIIDNIFAERFHENVCFCYPENSVISITKELITSTTPYKEAISNKYTHAFFEEYTENDRTTWLQIFFNASAIGEN